MSVGQNIKHDSALGHVTGQSVYVDDRPVLPNEVFVDYVLSPRAKGKVRNIDATKALALPGVLAVYLPKDLAHNKWGTIVQDQPLLAEDVSYCGEPVAIVVAERRELLALAKKNIQVEIEALKPVLDLQEAIDKKDFLYEGAHFVRGDVSQALTKSQYRLSGELNIGGQEHFYLESQAAVVYPLENGHVEVHSSTQHPTETQHVVAHALGLGFHQVTCVVKRMGGGFGGKESQAAPIAAMAAFVAHKLRRPARMALTKDDDMVVTGKRHPFKFFYEVGFNQEGRIQALTAKLYADGGAYTDLSPSIFDRALFHIDGAYYLENVDVKGFVCRTNYHSHTAFRGFGGPQGTMVIESIMEDIANQLKILGFEISGFEVRRPNLYQGDRHITPYGQALDHNPLPQIFDELLVSSEFARREKEIQEFNSKSKIKVRGISISATKFGIAFTARFLNQASALVNLHLDGSVQVSTGATEMGQGVNTKIQQIVAHSFAIRPEQVSVMPTSTEKNHNTSPTAASSGADLNGAAALKACEAIKARLKIVAHRFFAKEPFDNLSEYSIQEGHDLDHIEFVNSTVRNKKTQQVAPLEKILQVARLNRVSLGELAHFKTEDIGFDKDKVQGKPFNYFTNGAAVSEVEIDRFTGELKVLRVDILMDLGRLINPGIDRGQVTGGFVQALGWLTSEKLYYNSEGLLVSHSPTTYKIPNAQDTPRVFKVSFIEHDYNQQNVLRSKAVGEPPFLLGSSVVTAVKNALSFMNPKVLPCLDLPATNEVLVLEMARLKGQV